MKEQFTTTKSETPTLDKIIAEAQAKRPQEQSEHAKTMAILNQLKKGSIFSK
jgi:hypothetical protein